MDFHQRLEYSIKTKYSGVWAELARAAGIAPQSLQSIKHGAEPRLSTLKRICSALKVSPNWLIYGDTALAFAGNNNEIICIPKLDIYLRADQGAEFGSDVYPNPQEYLAFRRSWIEKKRLDPARLKVMRAKGDSMTPEINDGDSVLIDERKVTSLSQQHIYCVRHSDGISLKRVVREAERWSLLSRNTNYPQFYYSEIEILGRLIWRGQSLI